MTYCLGIVVRDGLVMIADTRTNAGLDNIATFQKLHLFETPGERVIALATAGNLAVTQSVLTLVSEGFDPDDSGETKTLNDVSSMFAAAQLVGAAIRTVRRIDGEQLEQSGGFDVNILVGGQLEGGRLRLFQVYSAGNFIEATIDTPYLQIGEHKYGKPILDRSVSHDTDLYDALKVGLISMDSTMRSNLGVGMPIDVMTLGQNAVETDLVHRIDVDDPYFSDLRNRWSRALTEAHRAIPRPPYAGSS